MKIILYLILVSALTLTGCGVNERHTEINEYRIEACLKAEYTYVDVHCPDGVFKCIRCKDHNGEFHYIEDNYDYTH